jgi:hypothetical protein
VPFIYRGDWRKQSPLGNFVHVELPYSFKIPIRENGFAGVIMKNKDCLVKDWKWQEHRWF